MNQCKISKRSPVGAIIYVEWNPVCKEIFYMKESI
jgi:hypothetical protein